MALARRKVDATGIEDRLNALTEVHQLFRLWNEKYDLKTPSLEQSADEFGFLKALSKDVEARLDLIKNRFESAPKSRKEVIGIAFRVIISRFKTTKTSWKAVALALNAPASLIKKHTTKPDVVKVEVRAR